MKCWPRTLVQPGVEDLHDVGVDQARGCLRLALEARHEGGVLGQVLGQQLDRHPPLQALVEGEVDGRHAAEAQSAFEPVAARDLLSAHLLPSSSPAVPPVPRRVLFMPRWFAAVADARSGRNFFFVFLFAGCLRASAWRGRGARLGADRRRALGRDRGGALGGRGGDGLGATGGARAGVGPWLFA